MERIIVSLIVAICLLACDSSIGNSSKNSSDTNISNIDNSINNPENDSPNGQNPNCSGINGIDGSGGFLWKPEGENTGNLVVLFPSEFTDRFLSVVATIAGDFEEGTFTGFSNGDRQTWRFSKPGSAYDGKLIVDANNQECVWQVANPSDRQD